MKITRLESFLTNCGLRNYLFVRLTTDTGLTGLGEATLEWQEASVQSLLHEWAEERIVGVCPFDIERVFGDLIRDQYQDPAIRTAAETLIDRLGLGLAGLVNILNPDRIVLGGLHRTLLDADPDRLRAVVADRSLWGRSGGVPILACTLDHNSLVGAAELAWQPVLDDPLGALTRG
jgi:hypothetical protein